MILSFWQALLLDEGWQQYCDQSSHFPPPTDSPSTQWKLGQRSPWQTVDFCPSSVSGWLVPRPNRGSPSFADFGMPEERKALWMACLSVKQWAVNPENCQRLRNSVRKHEIKLNGKFATWTVKCGPKGFVESTILNFNLIESSNFTNSILVDSVLIPENGKNRWVHGRDHRHQYQRQKIAYQVEVP